jgi:hypothetical protein
VSREQQEPLVDGAVIDLIRLTAFPTRGGCHTSLSDDPVADCHRMCDRRRTVPVDWAASGSCIRRTGTDFRSATADRTRPVLAVLSIRSREGIEPMLDEDQTEPTTPDAADTGAGADSR